MKVRIKFAKTGNAVYVGHLDVMRYFQKAVRRAKLAPAFTKGFSPHMIMSFAAPLGVGMQSLGEYFDIELNGRFSSEEIVKRRDGQMAAGFRVLDAVEVESGKSKNAMSLVAACDYEVELSWNGEVDTLNLQALLQAFLGQEEILITKEGKAGAYEVNIRPFIYEAEVRKPQELFLRLASASANYTRPDQFLDALWAFAGMDPDTVSAKVTRLEVYAQNPVGEGYVSLLSLGEHLEEET